MHRTWNIKLERDRPIRISMNQLNSVEKIMATKMEVLNIFEYKRGLRKQNYNIHTIHTTVQRIALCVTLKAS